MRHRQDRTVSDPVVVWDLTATVTWDVPPRKGRVQLGSWVLP